MEQGTEEGKQESERKDEQLNETCGTGVTLTQENIVLGEENKSEELQHVDYTHQEKSTFPWTKTTQLEVEVEVHQAPLQQLHIDIKDQEKSATTEKEFTCSDVVATFPFEVQVERTVSMEKSIQEQAEIMFTDTQQQEVKDNLVPDINMGK